jgi:putative sugar O-methyltransferase
MQDYEKSMNNKDKFARIYEMQEVLSEARKEIQPSEYWTFLNNKNLEQLITQGYENFKTTLALNYFTWVTDWRVWKDDQFKYLFKNIPIFSTFKSILRALRGLISKRIKNFTYYQQFSLSYLTYMLWEFVSRNDPERLTVKLIEPLEGNPPRLYLNKRIISQDLANAILEYKAVMSQINKTEINSILELGAGYGRTSYIFLKLLPNVKYIIADIPPALYIAENYLSNQFSNRNIFKFRKFTDFKEIKEEFENADIAFFLPNQLELLPQKIADLFLNISSLHEMRLDQILYYFDCIDRLIKKYVYLKQWKVSEIPHDNIIIREDDYPIRENWKEIYWRECKVKTDFFEALFRID